MDGTVVSAAASPYFRRRRLPYRFNLTWLLVSVLVGGCTSGSGSSPEHVLIQGDGRVTLVGDELRLIIKGLRGGQSTTAHATSVDARGVHWAGAMPVKADAQGQVALDATALLASMRPDSSTAGAYFWRTSGPQDFALTVADATYTMKRQLTQYPVTTMPLTAGGLHGVFYRPTLPGRHPAVVVIGGSEGGQPGRLYPTVLASRGFPVLALAYFKTSGLPQTLNKIPLEYFASAFQWLGQQPDVDRSRMVIDGVSRGGEAALLIGATFPELVHGVIAEVPSSVALCGYPNCEAGSAWTLRGQPVPFSRHMNEIPPRDNRAAAIKVEDIGGPVLMNCGGQDRVWDSCDYARAAMERLAHSPHGHQLQACDSCDHYIGHLVPDEPLSPAVAGPQHAADADAQPKFFRSLLALLASV